VSTLQQVLREAGFDWKFEGQALEQLIAGAFVALSLKEPSKACDRGVLRCRNFR
jgi:hypothetical protein